MQPQHHNSGVVVAGSLLLIVSLLHLLRAIYQLPIEVSGVEIPVYASYIAFVIAGLLGYMCIRRAHME